MYIDEAEATRGTIPIEIKMGDITMPAPIPREAERRPPMKPVKRNFREFFNVHWMSLLAKLYPISTFSLNSAYNLIMLPTLAPMQTTHIVTNKSHAPTPHLSRSIKLPTVELPLNRPTVIFIPRITAIKRIRHPP